jgi:hypothetical protein
MIAVGVDTHKTRHYAVAVGRLGSCSASSQAPRARTARLSCKLCAECLAEGQRLVFGVEGAGLYQYLQRAAHTVVELERPRPAEPRAGKFDRIGLNSVPK